MKKIVVFFILILITFSISTAQDRFVLDGLVEGYEGKVKLILNQVKSNHEVDMENEQVVYMVDGRFRIEGEVTEPTLLSIRIRPEITENFDPRSLESAFIWIDNQHMTLYGERGNFHYCDVSGYSLQDENEKSKTYVRNNLNDFRSKIDSLSQEQTREAEEELKQMKSISEIYLENKYRLDYSYLYPNSFISVYDYSWFVKWIPEMVPKSHAVTFYNSLSDSLKNNVHGKQIKNYIDNTAVNKKLLVGDRPYDFALPDSSGTVISLRSLEGKVVLLDFWAAYCGPCRQEHKNYEKLYDEYKSQGFEILSVSQDRKKEHWLKAMKEDNITWSSVWDETMSVSKYTYLVSALPDNYLINSNGIIIAEDLRGETLRNTLDKLFNK